MVITSLLSLALISQPGPEIITPAGTRTYESSLRLESHQTLDCNGGTLRFERGGLEIVGATDVRIRRCTIEAPVGVGRALLIRNSERVFIEASTFRGGWSVATVSGIRTLRIRDSVFDSGRWEGSLEKILEQYDTGDVDRTAAPTNTHALIFENGPAEDVLLDGLTVYAFGLDLGVGQLNNWRGSNDITLINSTIYGGNHQVMNYRGQNPPADRSQITSASTRLTVRNNRLYFGVENAIYHRSVQGAIYEGNFINRANVIGWWSTASATNAAISARVPASTPGRPDLDRSQPLVIRGNTILNPGRRGGSTFGIVIRVDNAVVEGNTIIRESHFDEARLGTAVAGGAFSSGHRFAGNRIVNWARGFHLDWGQAIRESSRMTVYEGNRLENVNSGIFVMASTGGVIERNTFIDAGIGVNLWRGATGWLVRENVNESVTTPINIDRGAGQNTIVDPAQQIEPVPIPVEPQRTAS